MSLHARVGQRLDRAAILMSNHPSPKATIKSIRHLLSMQNGWAGHCLQNRRLMFPAPFHTSTHLKGGIFGVPLFQKREGQFSIRTPWGLSSPPANVDIKSLRKIYSQEKSFTYRKMSSQSTEKTESDVAIIDCLQDVPLSDSYEAAMKALSSLIRQQKRGDKKTTGGKYGKLDRMRMYLKILDLEEHVAGLKIIHVAGTKGKGSTCTFCEAILRESGFRTGLFTSPHLIDVRERFRINGVDISEAKFLLYFWNCWNELKEHETEDLPMPPLFQFLTVLAFKIFVSEQVDVSIIEVGLGGRNDSTNVIEKPVVCGITSLGMDHTETLGNTIGQIASHKAGIFKRQIPAFTVSQVSEAMDVLQENAQELMVPLKVVEPLDSKALNGLQLSLSGDHQFSNAGLAVSLCKSWFQRTGNWEKLFQKDNGEANLPEAFLRGLSTAHLPGRAQIVHDSSSSSYISSEVAETLGDLIFYLDGAHSPESIEACAKWFSVVVKGNDQSPSLVSSSSHGIDSINVRDPQILLPRLVSTCASSGTRFSKAIFVPSISTYSKVTSGTSVIPSDISSKDLSWQFSLQRLWERIVHGIDTDSLLEKSTKMGDVETLPRREFLYEDASNCSPSNGYLACSAVIPSLPLTIKWLRDCVRENPSLRLQEPRKDTNGRPTTSTSQTSSAQLFTSRLLLLLTLLPLTLAAFAFLLQWRGGLTDPTTRWSPDHHEFPGMESISGSIKDTIRNSGSGCTDLLGQSHSLSFPYFRDWKFGFGSDLKPKICITTSTSAGLEQTLPWIFYHKVMGVSTFFLFVEGKAASPTVSKILETIPGVKVIYRTRELEEQQAKRLISFLLDLVKLKYFVHQLVIYRIRELEEQQAKRMMPFLLEVLVICFFSFVSVYSFKSQLTLDMSVDNSRYKDLIEWLPVRELLKNIDNHVEKFFSIAVTMNLIYMLRNDVNRIWNETWLSSFFYKPCNYELFVKQSLNMEMAIVMAREAGVDWIIHLDTDELIHPAGAREYSLRQLLMDVPGNVDMVIFPNYESSVERDDIKEPFSEVSLFKKNYDHLPKDVYFGNYKEATRGNPNYFLTYGNGKSAARIQDHLRPNGAHRWHNYMKTPNEVKLEEAAVLHYTYPKFSDLTSRRDRCGCKPTKEDVKRCFMLEFDRSAFIIASTATEEEMLLWYRERIVWTDKALNLKLLRKGILTRIYTPMVIVQRLRETGVFSSVIASAQVVLSSVKNSNSSTAGVSSSSKIGHDGESKATARRVLQIPDNSSFSSAIPPLSPPGLEAEYSFIPMKMFGTLSALVRSLPTNVSMIQVLDEGYTIYKLYDEKYFFSKHVSKAKKQQILGGSI
ncbi:hypothetical protein SADUNF_Sadunf16G0039100 [Salix dunnii]|uniref:Folylpolyglutamate synthase n=1 Tax=Salix dunnii TaxID=1413687 RepID=A0A835J926_9ROSI|nr:hypothetical protein SADUNF_Sadunf16G0039100 [Salix dunnii]